MPETRHRTILEVGIDDRDLRRLAPTMERALNPKVAEAFEKSMDRSTAALAKLIEQQVKLGRVLDDQAKRQQSRARDENRREREESAVRDRDTEKEARRNRVRRLVGYGNHIAGNLPSNEGFLPQALSGIPFIGPMFSGAVSGAQAFWQAHVARQTGRARAFGATGLSGADYGGQLGRVGTRLGYSGAELPGVVGGFGQASGMRGAGLAGAAPTALRLQALGGIDVGASGSIANSMLTGRQAQGGRLSEEDNDRASSMISEAVAAGLEGGLRDSRLGEMMQQIGGLITQMRTQGIMIDAGGTLALVRGLGQIGEGFGGEAGAHVAQQITSGMAGAGDRQNVIAAVAIRNRMQQHGESYMTAARMIESNPAEAFQSVMGTLQGAAGGQGGEYLESFLRTQFQGMGVQLSRTQAHTLAGMSPDQLAGMSGPTEGAAGTTQSFLSARQRQTGGIFGAPRAEAAYQNRRADIGAQPGVGRTVAGLRNLEMDVIQQFMPVIQSVASGIIRLLQGLFTAFQSGGLSGMSQYALTQGQSMTNTALDAVTPGGANTVHSTLAAVPGALSSIDDIVNHAAHTGDWSGVGDAIDDVVGNMMVGGGQPASLANPTAPRISSPTAAGGLGGASTGRPAALNEIVVRVLDDRVTADVVPAR